MRNSTASTAVRCTRITRHGCNVASVNMSGHKAGGGGTGVGRVGGKMHLEDISMGIITDKALPKLLEAAVKGKVFKKVEIHGTATYGDAGEQVYLAIELENVQITSATSLACSTTTRRPMT